MPILLRVSFVENAGDTPNNEFYKGISYIKGLLGDKITRSALIYDGAVAINSQESGAINFRDFYLEQ